MNQERNHSIDNQQVLKNCGHLDCISEIRFTWQHKCPVIPITLDTKFLLHKKAIDFWTTKSIWCAQQQKLALPGLYCIWCCAHQIDLVVQKVIAFLCNKNFVSSIMSITGHLHCQVNLISDMQSKCPQFVNTH